jgi:hypothetical protein
MSFRQSYDNSRTQENEMFQKEKTNLDFYRDFTSAVVANNRKEATVNRALDGSMYPRLKASAFCIW